MLTLRKPYRLLSVLIAMALFPAVSYGQASALPNKAVRIIVPNAAAGPLDLVGRLIAPKLSETLGQSVIVENRPSPNGVIGSEYVAHAVADGSVLGAGNSGTHAVNATLYKTPTYDPVRDFAPISQVIVGSLVVVANPAVRASNITELIAEAKGAPGKLNIAIAGATAEVAGNMIKLMGHIEMNNVPYKGSVPAEIAVISNESQLMLTLFYPSLGSSIETGKLKPIGVTGSQRVPQLPNVPTLAERVRRDTGKYRKIILESGMQRLD